MLDRAAYLGREFVRAETAPISGTEYIQINFTRKVGRLDRVAYLGREFVRAETASISGTEYIQD